MLSPKIVGFCGYPGSGKDEAAKILIAHGWQRLAFADPLRAMLLALDPLVFTAGDKGIQRLSVLVENKGWIEAKKLPEVRCLLQRMGTEAGRNVLGENIWVDTAQRSIEIGKRVIFTDVRFPNEAEMIHSRGGKLYWVGRPGVDRVNVHSSENYSFEIDGRILNDGTIEDLHNKVLEIVGISL